jgi:hypothetical protein
MRASSAGMEGMMFELFAYSWLCCFLEAIHADDLQRLMAGPIGQFFALRLIPAFGDEGPPGLLRGGELEEVWVHVVVYVLGGFFGVVGEDRLLVSADWMGEDGAAEGDCGGVA